MSPGCENWLITVNPLAASGKANIGGTPNALGLIALTNCEIQLARLRVAQHDVAGFSKANARFFKLTHGLETAS
jgi:hypothetical protein